MSAGEPSLSPRARGIVVVCLTFVTIAIIAAIVSINLGSGDSGRAATVTTILAGNMALVLTALTTLVRVAKVSEKVDRVLNGVMDEKIKNNVRLALAEHEDTKKG